MLYSIKKYINDNKNKVINLKINNIRNKSEYVNGRIIEVYERFFVIDCFDGIKMSFNYSDILTKNVEILGQKY